MMRHSAKAVVKISECTYAKIIVTCRFAPADAFYWVVVDGTVEFRYLGTRVRRHRFNLAAYNWQRVARWWAEKDGRPSKAFLESEAKDYLRTFIELAKDAVEGRTDVIRRILELRGIYDANEIEADWHTLARFADAGEIARGLEAFLFFLDAVQSIYRIDKRSIVGQLLRLLDNGKDAIIETTSLHPADESIDVALATAN